MYSQLLNSISISFTCQNMNICVLSNFPGVVAAILDFTLPVWLYNIHRCSSGSLNPSNVETAFLFAFLSHFYPTHKSKQAYKRFTFFSGLVAAIFDFPLPVWSHNVPNIYVGLLDPENIWIAVEIMFLALLEAGDQLGVFLHLILGRM